MRILYISNSTSGGGAPASLFNLVEGLKDRHDIAVVLPEPKGDLYEKLRSAGVPVYAELSYVLDIWPKTINPFRLITRFIRLWKNRTCVRKYVAQVIEDFRPEIVHTNVGPLAIAFSEAARCGIPHVWHMREYQDKDFGMTFFPSKDAFLRMIHSESNYNIAITEDVFRHWNLRKDRDVVVYNAVRADAAQQQASPADHRYFLYVGRIEKTKGLMMLLKAFRMYRKDGGQNHLLVAGRPCGLYSVMCRFYAKLSGLGQYVHFLGQRRDVPALMQSADAFVMTSVSEGFGLTTAEAMINRCFVIGRDSAGTKEQFDRGAAVTGSEIALRFKDIIQLKDCLEYVSDKNNSARIQSIIDNAEKVVLASYSAERYVGEIENYYKRILGL